MDKKIITDLSVEELKEYCAPFSPFAYKQVLNWVYNRGVLDPSQFTNLSKPFREQLSKDFLWDIFVSEESVHSKDGTVKFLFKTHHNDFIESVFMPSEKRHTLCISSQVGCARGCTFCQTGKMGLMRNLTAGEIVGQIIYITHKLKTNVTNIVFMGMGEPLDNFEEVQQSIGIMVDLIGIVPGE